MVKILLYQNFPPLSIGKLHKHFSRNPGMFVQHYHLIFALGCAIILLSVGGMATEPPIKNFKKSLKKLLTNGLNYDIIVNVRWGKQPTKPNKKNKKIQKKA